MQINFNKFFQQWNEMKASKGLMERSITDAFAGSIEEPKKYTGPVGVPQEPLEKPVQFAGTESRERHIPSTNIGGITYKLIPDEDKYRKMIQLDPNGGVSPNSPVIPVGKDVGGGFILMARPEANINPRSVPITRTKEGGFQINYPQSESNPNVLSQIQRTGPQNVQSIIDMKVMDEFIKLYGGATYGLKNQ